MSTTRAIDSDIPDECEVTLHGTAHACRLENLSSTEARVNCLGFLHETWPGDECVLHLHNQSGAYRCRVTSITASRIALQVLQQNDAGG